MCMTVRCGAARWDEGLYHGERRNEHSRLLLACTRSIFVVPWLWDKVSDIIVK